MSERGSEEKKEVRNEYDVHGLVECNLHELAFVILHWTMANRVNNRKIH